MKYIITKTWTIDESEFSVPAHSKALRREMAMKLTKIKKPIVKMEEHENPKEN